LSGAVEITVLNRQRGYRIATGELRDFVEQLAEAIPSGAESVAICLVSDPAMRRYNQQFRAIDRATDVLSFPAGEELGAEVGRNLGDILISVATAARQASEAGHSLERELKLLTLHGYLHLLGHDHETDDGEMMQLQRDWSERLLPLTAEAGS